MSAPSEDIPYELLARYAAGDCGALDTATLSQRVVTEPAVADALADMLLHAVAVRDDAATHPYRFQPAPPEKSQRFLRSSLILPVMVTALAVSLILLHILTKNTMDANVLHITAINGSVRWTGRGGEVRDGLQPGSKLPGGLLEALGETSMVTVDFADQTRITLSGQSAAALSANRQIKVHLRAGSLSAEVRPQPPGCPLVVDTSTARLEVLGTCFEVESDPANTRLIVVEGRVRMTQNSDGRSAEVPARHEALASLTDGRGLRVLPRKQPDVLWRSDIAAGPADARGRWLPADAEKPARIATEPVFLSNSSRGPVTIHRVGLSLPWQNHANIQARPGSFLRLRGNAARPGRVEVMMACMKAEGGYSGNWFAQRDFASPRWQLDVPISAFRHWNAQAKSAPQEPLELRQIAIYTIDEDAGLEVESVELFSDEGGKEPP